VTAVWPDPTCRALNSGHSGVSPNKPEAAARGTGLIDLPGAERAGHALLPKVAADGCENGWRSGECVAGTSVPGHPICPQDLARTRCSPRAS